MIIQIIVVALLDHVVSISAEIEFAAVAGATCLWFIASEGMSILENAAEMGVPIPKIMTQALELFKVKGGSDHPPDEDKTE